MTVTLDQLMRAICREECAFRGEPPCWNVLSDWDGEKYVAVWPNPNCDEPGCEAIAQSVLALTLHNSGKAQP